MYVEEEVCVCVRRCVCVFSPVKLVVSCSQVSHVSSVASLWMSKVTNVATCTHTHAHQKMV